MTWILGSASTHATRRAGPGPQDDMFLSSFYFEIFLYRHPGAGRDPLRRRQHLCRRAATHIIHWIATVAFIVCARNVHRRIRGIG